MPSKHTCRNFLCASRDRSCPGHCSLLQEDHVPNCERRLVFERLEVKRYLVHGVQSAVQFVEYWKKTMSKESA